MHPIHHVHDGYINSYTLGRRLNLLNPVPEDITIEDIAGKRRTRDIVIPRQVAMYILREELGLSFPQIAGHLGGRDHTTIMHGFSKITTMVTERDPIAQDISEVRLRLHQEFTAAAR